ncbi:hypothetical protein GYB59_00680 [bacterium]|nr:hypothetical protein [bacterium]
MARWNGKAISSRRHSLAANPDFHSPEYIDRPPQAPVRQFQLDALNRNGTIAGGKTSKGYRLTWSPTMKWWARGVEPVTRQAPTYRDVVDLVWRGMVAQARNMS